MTSYVTGVHLAPSSVAIAVITRRVDSGCVATIASFTSRAPAGDRITDLTAVADHAVCAPVLAVLGSSGTGAAGQLRHAVRSVLAARGVPVATTGERITGIAEWWPALRPASASEVTALGLAHLGAVRLGRDVPAQTHRDVVEGTALVVSG